MQSVAELLGAHGPFAQLIPGFAPRVQQQEMAEAVADALSEQGRLIAEAGTGTGKTFAYLVPALLSGEKVIVSTGTRNLQDQLFHKDLPLVREALGIPVEVALLKGRANYLCVHRMDFHLTEGRFADQEHAEQLRQVQRWAARTRSGDIAELSELPEDAQVWPLVTSTADNCLGGECERWDECHLAAARRRAQAADLLVVNHHLLFADMALRDDGFGELLPGANAFILDEAHQLPEIASNFFGTTLSANQLFELCRDSVAEDLREAGERPELRNAAQVLEQATRELRLAMGAELRRGPWGELAAGEGLEAALVMVGDGLQALDECLQPLAQRGKGLESCLRRCLELQERFDLLAGATPDGYIHWFETHRRSFTINLTPMDVAEPFQRQLQQSPCAWIFTSATLTVGDSFAHFAQRLGVEGAHTGRWESPFDFRHQALLYVPPQMPDPATPGYTEAVVDAVLPVLEASGGRAFVLFTSHRALREAAERLVGSLDYPLLVQGESPRARLLARFRELGNAVLLGTGSFWEGVDVRGAALSCVIIDKLPFASPGDPILRARIDALREQGGNPFMDYQLPQAVIALKQGVGRLIRDVNDRGLLMICDPRLRTKTYGRVFLDSLPAMPRSTQLDVVQRFFALEGDTGVIPD